MEQAIIQTLKYFNRPLKAWEIHKWLVGKKARLRAVEKSLGKLVQSGKCRVQSEYYGVKDFRENNLSLVTCHLSPGQRFRLEYLKRKDGVRLVSYNGENFYIINGSKAMDIKPHNLDVAYRLLSMRVLWQKDKTYFKVLEENSWAFKFFPNWTSSTS